LKVLVTGAGGYIGSVLCPYLLERGYFVTALDNFLYKENSLAMCCLDKNFRLIKSDVRNTDLLKELVPSHDILIPLAALVGAPICAQDPIGAHSINYESVITLFSLVSKSQLVLMPTTNSAYGSGDANNFCDEESPLNPLSKYAIDKVEIEKRLLSLENSISFRLATVFGMSPRMRLDLLVNDFTYRAFSDGFTVLFESHFKRNYIHIRDVCRVFLHGIDNHLIMNRQVYNVGLSDANLSKLELCQEIQKQLPDFTFIESAVGTDPDKRNYIVSNKKIESTGFSPSVSLQDGISELIKGYNSLSVYRFKNI